MDNASFIHLQVRSEFSLLEGAIRIPQLISACNTHQMPAVALTDKGNMFGAVDFYFEAKRQGIRPIIGCELHWTTDIAAKAKPTDRIILLCMNTVGYENLCHIVTDANIHGFYYVPRVDMSRLADRTEGLICILPGYGGPVQQLIQSYFMDDARHLADAFRGLFPDRLYLGVQRTNEPGMPQLANDVIEFGTTHAIPLVALNDVYFLESTDGWMHDMVTCIKTGREIDSDDQANASLSQHYLTSPQHMADLFADCPQALANTVAIAKQCDLTLAADHVLLPRFNCPEDQTPDTYLTELVWQGIHKKYSTLTDTIKERVAFELATINQMNYAIYFLIIYDFLDFCLKSDIPVGPGRGSAAGSIVAYALNITKIDPIEYNLLFERFLNPERVSMPDIDIDFCIKRRGEVIAYISQTYGSDHVAQIVTFGTMAARGVIRDVGRALGVPLSAVDRLAKMVPSSPGHMVSIAEALDTVPELAAVYNTDPQAKQLLDYGMKLEGLSRHASTHAAGIVISRDPLSKLVPLMTNDGQVTTQYTMTNLEKLGLLKMDILGLRNLTVIRDTGTYIHEHTPDFDIDKIPLDDPDTYAVMATGVGIFQCESPGMRRLIADLKPQCFEDVIAVLALYRPGPLGSGMVNDFISNKSGKTQVAYDLPQLEPILKDTYGMIVYQEQVMQIATTVGGFTLGESDMLRRAMGKKKKDEMAKMRDAFLSGAKQQGIAPEVAEKVFNLCDKFAEYGFNKSHSAAYALISYQTAYLKAHFPREYMLGLLLSVVGNTDRTAVYVAEAKRLGLVVAPPNVNRSHYSPILEGDTIVFGLGGIKAIGEAPVQALVQEREANGPFTTLFDFFNRLNGRDINKRVFEHLIRVGALDDIDPNRSRLLGCYEQILEHMAHSRRHRMAGQVGLFDTLEEDHYTDLLDAADYREYTTLALLQMEKELMGDYLSAHPLTEFREMWEAGVPLVNLTVDRDGEVVTVVGILENVIQGTTKNDNPFVRGDIADFDTKIGFVVFDFGGGSFGRKGVANIDVIKNDAIVRMTGTVVNRSSEISLRVESVVPISNQLAETICHIDILDESLGPLHAIHGVCKAHRGNIPIYFHVRETIIKAGKKFWITKDAIGILESMLGEQTVWVES